MSHHRPVEENLIHPTVAALDVGSNSVRLLVASSRCGVFVPIYTDRITTRLFQGLMHGRLDEAAIERTAKAIEALSAAAREHGASEVLGFGTSAMRDGVANRNVLIEAAARCGASLEVLSGEDEASISYAGAAPSGRAGVIDIGGGSTELLLGNNGRVVAMASAQVGAVRLLEALRGCDHMPDMIAAAKRALSPAASKIKHEQADAWIGLGGTITTAAAMHLKLEKYDQLAIDGHEVSADFAKSLLELLLSLPTAGRCALPGLDPARADILPYGLAILCAFFELLGTDAVCACDRDNLIGFLMKKRPEMLDKGTPRVVN